MAVVGFLVFTGALAASIAVFWLTLVPALPRIVALLRDGVDPAHRQLSFSFSEPRPRVRSRAASVAARQRLREAA